MSHRSGKFLQPTKSNVFLFCASIALAKCERQGFQPVSQQFALRTRQSFHDLLRQFPLSYRGRTELPQSLAHNSLDCGNQDAPSTISCSNSSLARLEDGASILCCNDLQSARDSLSRISHNNSLFQIMEDGVPTFSRNNSVDCGNQDAPSTISRNNSSRRATMENNHSSHEARLTELAAVAPARMRAHKDSEIWEIREFTQRNARR